MINVILFAICIGIVCIYYSMFTASNSVRRPSLEMPSENAALYLYADSTVRLVFCQRHLFIRVLFAYRDF